MNNNLSARSLLNDIKTLRDVLKCFVTTEDKIRLTEEIIDFINLARNDLPELLVDNGGNKIDIEKFNKIFLPFDLILEEINEIIITKGETDFFASKKVEKYLTYKCANIGVFESVSYTENKCVNENYVNISKVYKHTLSSRYLLVTEQRLLEDGKPTKFCKIFPVKEVKRKEIVQWENV